MSYRCSTAHHPTSHPRLSPGKLDRAGSSPSGRRLRRDCCGPVRSNPDANGDLAGRGGSVASDEWRTSRTGPRSMASRRAGPRYGKPTDLRLRPHRRADRRVLDRHAATHRQRLAAHGPRVQLHPHRHDRPLPAHGRQAGLLPDGLGRQRPADRTARPELLRRPLRSEPALRRGVQPAVPRRTAEESSRRRHPPAELPRALRRAGRDRREGLRGAAAPARPVGRLDAEVRDDRRALPPRQPAGVPAQRQPGRGLQPGSADDVGHRLPHRRRPGRDGGPRAAGRLSQDRLPTDRRQRCDRDRHHPPRAARRLRGARRPPRRRAVPAALRHHGAHSALRRRGPRRSPTSSPSPTRAPASP